MTHARPPERAKRSDAAGHQTLGGAIDAVQVAASRHDDDAPASVPVTHVEPLEVPEWIVDLAHDMRSPLNAILFLTEAVRSGGSGEVNELQQRQLALMYTAAFRLASLADAVIDMRPDRDPLLGQHPLPFAVSEALGFVRDLLLPIAEGKAVALEFEAPADDLRIGYQLALGRALLNLTANALQNTEEGSVRVTLRDVGDGLVECAVVDTGPGVPTELLRWLAEPIGPRSGTSTRPFRSSGLGLAICRRLVEAMGGELRVCSRVGEGTRFSFLLRLPVAPPA